MGKWKEYVFKDIAKFIDYRGRTPKKTDKGIPLITAKNVRMGYVSEEPREYIATKDYEDWMTRGIPNLGDILFTTEAPLGNVAELTFANKIALAQRLVTFQPLNNDYISKFLKYYMLSPIFQKELWSKATGTTVKGIKTSILKKFKIPLPSLPEQQRIVAKLDGLFAKMDQAIGLLEENIAHTQALMGSVLDEEFNKLDCKWFKLEDISTIVGGGTPKTAISEYWADEVVWLSPVDLPPIGVISRVSDSGKKISQLGLQKSSAKLLPIGTVVYSSRASIGKIAITECELSTNQGFTNFIPNKGVDNMYLAKALKHYTPKIEGLSNSTTFKEVSKTSLKRFKIPIPKIEIQLELSKLFSDYQKNIDGIVSIQTHKLNHLKALKSSLLDQAFKGEL